MQQFDFNNLFVLDLANNHQGDMAHAKNVIRAMGQAVDKAGARAALKFQYRNLDTFIHPEYREDTSNKHIARFLGTELSPADYGELMEEVRRNGMLPIATPFDEASVDLILDQGLDLIKVASCSASDWPLLHKVARARKPVIASTAGLSAADIDRLVSFFEEESVEFALMHCVGIYPTPADKLNLNQIDYLRSRFPNVPVGWSTHEDPSDFLPVQMAYAKGARVFERHVGIPTEKYKLNGYSSAPEQVEAWINACQHARAVCGGSNRSPSPIEEIESLRSLKRGVFAARDLKKGEDVRRDDVFFAMPLQEDQLVSGQWHDGIVADRDYPVNSALGADLANLEPTQEEILYEILLQVKGMLNKARIFITSDSPVEVSHHYGLDRFREFGVTMINCINREYCKKLLVMLPRQKHPYHFHKRKEETFQLLYGDIEMEKNGEVFRLQPGEQLLVEPGAWHKFHTLDGAIIEEVSTTHYKNDSFYEDERINNLSLEQRKTIIDRFSDVAAN